MGTGDPDSGSLYLFCTDGCTATCNVGKADYLDGPGILYLFLLREEAQQAEQVGTFNRVGSEVTERIITVRSFHRELEPKVDIQPAGQV